jgi:Mitochondrial F1-F0 ATP synthase subunit F of fungi
MRFVPTSLKFIRSKSTLIPPKISSLAELGLMKSQHAQAHPTLFAKMNTMYVNLPKGFAPPQKTTGFLGWYHEKYIATSSFTPVLHFLVLLIPTAYYVAYIKGGHYHPRYEFH